MRIAIVSDIHGNRTAFEAVLADLQQTSPDLIPHGGDLAGSGSSPAEVLDHIRDLGWPGVAGNTDEMLFRPESLEEFASQSPKMQPLFTVIQEMAAATREALGEERLAWLRGLPPLDESRPAIRRVEYDVDRELKALSRCGLPHADWVAKMIESGCFQMP